MFVRVTRGRLDPARFDDLAGIAPDIAAEMRAQPGFQSYLAAGDRATGKLIAVTTWDTREHASLPFLAGVGPRLQAIGVQLDAPEIYQSFE